MAFVLWPNIILVVCLGIVASILGFVVYGLIVGFENTFTSRDDNGNHPSESPESGG